MVVADTSFYHKNISIVSMVKNENPETPEINRKLSKSKNTLF